MRITIEGPTLTDIMVEMAGAVDSYAGVSGPQEDTALAESLRRDLEQARERNRHLTLRVEELERHLTHLTEKKSRPVDQVVGSIEKRLVSAETEQRDRDVAAALKPPGGYVGQLGPGTWRLTRTQRSALKHEVGRSYYMPNDEWVVVVEEP